MVSTFKGTGHSVYLNVDDPSLILTVWRWSLKAMDMIDSRHSSKTTWICLHRIGGLYQLF
jgi:hypothetical protein